MTDPLLTARIRGVISILMANMERVSRENLKICKQNTRDLLNCTFVISLRLTSNGILIAY